MRKMTPRPSSRKAREPRSALLKELNEQLGEGLQQNETLCVHRNRWKILRNQMLLSFPDRLYQARLENRRIHRRILLWKAHCPTTTVVRVLGQQLSRLLLMAQKLYRLILSNGTAKVVRMPLTTLSQAQIRLASVKSAVRITAVR